MKKVEKIFGNRILIRSISNHNEKAKRVGYTKEKMLRVFIDEFGDFGQYASASLNYLEYYHLA